MQDLFLHLFPGFSPIVAFAQKLVVPGLSVPNMSRNGQPYCFLIKILPCRRPTNPATIFTASVLSYHLLSPARTGRKKLAHAQGKTLYILPVQLHLPLRLPFSPAGPHLAVGQAFRFSSFHRLFFYQQTLPLISLSSPAPLQHHRRKDRALAGSPGQRCIAGRKKDQVIQVGASQAQDSFAFHQGDPGSTAESLSALAARGIPVAGGNKYLQIVRLFHPFPKIVPYRSGDRISKQLLPLDKREHAPCLWLQGGRKDNPLGRCRELKKERRIVINPCHWSPGKHPGQVSYWVKVCVAPG
jgi:hypothetical protein